MSTANGIDPWAGLAAPAEAIALLQASAAAPVHAYLFVGPAGSGKRAAARAFAAALLSEGSRGAARERHVRLALAEAHPDLEIVEREGAFLSVAQARKVVERAALAPVEGARKVLVLDEFHLALAAAPVLLKTLEEPPEGTVFVILAAETPPELATVASRCVRLGFTPLPEAAVIERLVAGGADPEAAAAAARAAGGDLRRAELLAADGDLVERVAVWRAAPDQLDGAGCSAAAAAAALLDCLNRAQGAVEAKQHAEAAELAAREELYGARGAGRRQLEERQRRERRRLRADELRFGLSALGEVYRSRLEAALAGGGGPGAAAEALAALDALQWAADAVERNPNEALLLEALMVKLARLGD
ncbi:MAG: AAA family ATPase [Acidimicrobiales bacterium]